jgi:hypothetical protein
MLKTTEVAVKASDFFYWREPVIIFCISGHNNGRRVETGAYAEFGDHGVRVGIYRREY